VPLFDGKNEERACPNCAQDFHFQEKFVKDVLFGFTNFRMTSLLEWIHGSLKNCCES